MCNKWFHILCLGIPTLPKDDEAFYCPDCLKKENAGSMQIEDFLNEN